MCEFTFFRLPFFIMDKILGHVEHRLVYAALQVFLQASNFASPVRRYIGLSCIMERE